MTMVAGAFNAAGQSDSGVFLGEFNASLWGTFVGDVRLERSFDGGVTFIPCTDLYGAAVSFSDEMSIGFKESEQGVFYRFNCTAYTSGTINYRISK